MLAFVLAGSLVADAGVYASSFPVDGHGRVWGRDGVSFGHWISLDTRTAFETQSVCRACLSAKHTTTLRVRNPIRNCQGICILHC